jgi:hypothetical protein
VKRTSCGDRVDDSWTSQDTLQGGLLAQARAGQSVLVASRAPRSDLLALMSVIRPRSGHVQPVPKQ